MKYPEQLNPQKYKANWQLPKAREREVWEQYNSYGFLFCGDENILKLDTDGG